MALIGNYRTVNVDRIQLIDILKKNLEKHKAEYQAAQAGYQAAMLAELKKAMKEVKAGKVKELNVHLAAPFSNEDSYVEVIEMLEMSVDQNIQLDNSTFRSYVKDEWHWSGSFKALAASYSTIGGAM